MRCLAPLAAAAFLLAGCSSAAPATSPDGPADAPPAAAPKWSETSREGELTVATGTNPMAVADPQTFTVPAKAIRVWLNVTVTAQPSPEVEVRFIEPGCDQQGCLHDVRAEGGKVALDLEEPAAGEWGISFFGDPLPARGTYHLSVNSLLPGAAQG